LIELDKGSFDNIAWQIKNTTIKATVELFWAAIYKIPAQQQALDVAHYLHHLC